MLKIARVESEEDLEHIRRLFREYAAWLGFDLHFQDFEREFAELPGDYSPPTGRLLLATYGTEIAGCVALRKLSKGICEMKRLYVRPKFRDKGIGKSLSESIIAEARKAGYKQMRLDTVPSMKKAIALYRSLGFEEIEPYRHNPIKGAKFLELVL